MFLLKFFMDPPLWSAGVTVSTPATSALQILHKALVLLIPSHPPLVVFHHPPRVVFPHPSLVVFPHPPLVVFPHPSLVVALQLLLVRSLKLEILNQGSGRKSNASLNSNIGNEPKTKYLYRFGSKKQCPFIWMDFFPFSLN